MHIDISGDNIEVTEALKSHINEHFQKLERHSPHIVKIHVTLSVDKKYLQKAEAKIDMRKGNVFASAESRDMYNSIIDLRDKLDRQVLKHKEQMNSHDGGDEIL